MRNYLLTACLLALPITANSALVERLGGLAYYDTEADLTWLQDAHAGAGTSYDDGSTSSDWATDGAMSWQNANDWAASLNIAGVTGWRLPNTLQPDATCSGQNSGVSFGVNCTGSELGNLYYNVLGGIVNTKISDAHNSNYDFFSNVMDGYHWSVTEYAPDTSGAWGFTTNSGYQLNSLKAGTYLYAWAVHDGDIGAIPVPAAIWLFGSGLIGLIGLAKRNLIVEEICRGKWLHSML